MASTDEANQQLGVGRRMCPLDQPRHGIRRAAQIHFELRQQFVRQRQVRIKLDRAA